MLVAVLPAGGAGASPSKHDVQQATAKVQRLLGDIKDARGQLAGLQQDLAAKNAQVNDAADQLDLISAKLLSTQQQLAAAGSRYRSTIDDLNNRAAAAFMGGPSQNLGLLVGSSSLAELSDRMEFITVIGQSDADLAQTVGNTQGAACRSVSGNSTRCRDSNARSSRRRRPRDPR